MALGRPRRTIVRFQAMGSLRRLDTRAHRSPIDALGDGRAIGSLRVLPALTGILKSGARSQRPISLSRS